MTSSLQTRILLNKRIGSLNNAILIFKNMLANSTDNIIVFYLKTYLDDFEHLRAKAQAEFDELEEYAQRNDEENFFYR